MARPRIYSNKEEIIPLIDNYFKICDFDSKPYTITGLCLALKMCRDTLCEYEKIEEFSDTIKEAKQKVENWVEVNALINKANPTFAIFNLKNNFGWKDKQEIEEKVIKEVIYIDKEEKKEYEKHIAEITEEVNANKTS